MAPRASAGSFLVALAMIIFAACSNREHQSHELPVTEERVESLISRTSLLSDLREFWSPEKNVKIEKCLQTVDLAMSEPRVFGKNLTGSNCHGNWSECWNCQTLCKMFPDCCMENISDYLGYGRKNESHNFLECVPARRRYHYWSTTGCPKAWNEDDVRKKCEFPNVSEPLEILPVYASGLFPDYRNMYCAQCHGVEQYDYWDLMVRCSSLVSPDEFNSLSAFLKHIQSDVNCAFSAVAPSSHCLRECYSPELTQCYRTEFTIEQDEQKSKCENFRSRNESSAILLHLAMDDFRLPPRWCEQTRMIDTPTSLLALLNINPRNDLVIGERVEICPDDESYDPTLESCRKLECPLGEIPHRGECLRYFKESYTATQQSFLTTVYLYHYGIRTTSMQEFLTVCQHYYTSKITPLVPLDAGKVTISCPGGPYHSYDLVTDSCTHYYISTDLEMADHTDKESAVTYLRFDMIIHLSQSQEFARTYALIETIKEITEFEYMLPDKTSFKRIAAVEIDQRCNWTDTADPLENNTSDMTVSMTYPGSILLLCIICSAILRVFDWNDP